MNNPFFVEQVNRLRTRFGENAFDKEFTKLVANEVGTMSEYGFKRACDIWIGSRSRGKAPLLSEFREARLAEEKIKLDNATYLAANILTKPQKFGGLKLYLEKEFPGCKTLAQAVEVRRLQIRLAKIENPDYDPMSDKKFMGGHAWLPKGPE